MCPAKDASETEGDPARRERVRDIKQWLDDPKIQRGVAHLVDGGRKSERDPDSGDGNTGGQ
jgi:hypothetical protein